MKKELNEQFIIDLSKKKNEPEWMLEFRLKSYEKFKELDNPSFGPKLEFDFENINYYKGNEEKLTNDWEKVNCSIRNRFDELGVIDAEEKYLGGVTNQFESEVVYHNQSFEDEGIIFTSTDDALQKHPELFKEYFNHLVNYAENKYTALNGAVWSGGSFIYIPAGVKVKRIIVDEGADLSYIEGCTAKNFAASSLHAGVVEIFIKKNAHCRYSTIQNWSTDVYNLVTKRAIVDDYGTMEWVDGNIGSKVTMKYPSCILKGEGATGNSISIAYAKENQELDAGAKMIHLGPYTKSNIVSKSIAEKGGVSNYRGTTKIGKKAHHSKATIKCDTILLDDLSKSDTYPTNILGNKTSTLEHEATISKVSAEKLFYLTSKGLSEDRAKELLIMGFISDFKKELPMEYAVELNRLLKE